MSKFRVPVYIRCNTPQLRKKLEHLGYTYCGKGESDDSLYCHYGRFYEVSGKPGRGEVVVDCGTNESLFLALAALRKDSDYMQWFIDKRGVFVQCQYDQIREFIDRAAIHGYDIGGDWLRKAMPEELFNHFGTNNL